MLRYSSCCGLTCVFILRRIFRLNCGIRVLCCTRVCVFNCSLHGMSQVSCLIITKNIVTLKWGNTVRQIPTTCFPTLLRCKLQREVTPITTTRATCCATNLHMTIKLLQNVAKSLILLLFATFCCNLRQKRCFDTSCTCVVIISYMNSDGRAIGLA